VASARFNLMFMNLRTARGGARLQLVVLRRLRGADEKEQRGVRPVLIVAANVLALAHSALSLGY